MERALGYTYMYLITWPLYWEIEHLQTWTYPPREELSVEFMCQVVIGFVLFFMKGFRVVSIIYWACRKVEWTCTWNPVWISIEDHPSCCVADVVSRSLSESAHPPALGNISPLSTEKSAQEVRWTVVYHRQVLYSVTTVPFFCLFRSYRAGGGYFGNQRYNPTISIAALVQAQVKLYHLGFRG